MKRLFGLIGLCCASGALAHPSTPAYPSCAVTEQRTLKAPAGDSGADAMRTHVALRVNTLEADIGTARKARLLSATQAQRLERRVVAVRTGSDRLSHRQGFLSAAEQASYDRRLDAIALEFCR